jgi:hypothetical protein
LGREKILLSSSTGILQKVDAHRKVLEYAKGIAGLKLDRSMGGRTMDTLVTTITVGFITLLMAACTLAGFLSASNEDRDTNA